MIYYKDFDISTIFANAEILKRKRGHRAPQNKRRDYISILSCFDIETTRLEDIDQSVMYIWQWGFYDLNTDNHICVLYGRTWDEYIDLCEKIKDEITKLIIFDIPLYMVRLVHNLAYEFQFLSGVVHYGVDDVFIIKNRKPVRADSFGCIEDRCTYLHSNLSLEKYAKQWGAEHQKQSGVLFDYTKHRFYFTALTDNEMRYCEYDILSCLDAYTNEMKYYNDNLYSVPLTSTGYVRRDAKNEWGKIPYDTRKKWGISDLNLYNLLHDAFRGGNTHANRYFVAPEDHKPFIIENVYSYDRSSSYPDVMCNMLFPLGEWKQAFHPDIRDITFCQEHNRAFVFRVSFRNIRLKDIYWGCPYLSVDKCPNLKTSRANPDLYVNRTEDNGRIIDADEVITAITDVDYTIIKEEYIWDDMQILDFYSCRYVKLPDEFINLIQTYYRKKTELKNVAGREWEYAESKAKINSLYGMCAQKVVRDQIVFDESNIDLYIVQKMDAEAQLKAALRKGFLPYSIGVYVTAWARYWLERAIRLVHDTPNAYFIYTDTDSIKFTGDVDFTALNDELRENSIKSKSFAVDQKGVTHYMGVYEYEGMYPKFATMGAKKYIYGDDDNIHVTISGVVKYHDGHEVSAEELKEKGGFDAFRAGTVFTKAGGTEAIYNDDIDTTINIDGHPVHITRNICLRPSTYTLGLSAEYERLLKYLCGGVDNVGIL